MVETYNSEIVQNYLNGYASESMPMMQLMAQVIVILIIGIALWRISTIFNKRKVNRRENVFSQSRFQKHWRNK